jgi:hypothetical protein
LIPKPGSIITIFEGSFDKITALDPMGKPFTLEYAITSFDPIMPLCTMLAGKAIMIVPYQKINITFGVSVKADNGKKITSGNYIVKIIYKTISFKSIFDS